MDPIRDRARGCLLGLAVGDALGGPLEFLSADEIVGRHDGPVSDMVGGGWLSLRPGQVTDDTDMARALARSLVERGCYEPEAALANYMRWLATDPPDIGTTIRAVLQKVAGGVEADDAARQVHEQSGGLSAGNGSLMRIAPLAIRYRDDTYALMEAAQRDSALTHFDPLAGDVCALYCVIVAAELKGQELLEAPARSEALIETLNSTPDEAAGRASDQRGFVLTAFAVAFCAYRHFESLEEGLVWAVNLGGDADTNGAVTGALLGARDGVSAIPKRWLDQLEPRAELTALSDQLLESAQS